MAMTTAASGAQPRFEPALMRRKLTGTLFYGACLLAIAILILALIALLLNVLVVGAAVAQPGLHHRHAVPPAGADRDPARTRRLDPARHHRRPRSPSRSASGRPSTSPNMPPTTA